MKHFFLNLYNNASYLNEKHIISLIDKYGKAGEWLDLGCDDGTWTKKITSKNINWHGVEVVKSRADLAKNKGINVRVSSLEEKLPYKNNFFNLIHSNQVIEHLVDLDMFLSEIYRVLKPKGILIISTENPASWHNILALLAGWQMFSATNVSVKKLGLGNPMALTAGKKFEEIAEGRTSSWAHNKLLTPKALAELLVCYSFKILQTIGAGYHPFPAKIGEIDVNHSHFYVIACQK